MCRFESGPGHQASVPIQNWFLQGLTLQLVCDGASAGPDPAGVGSYRTRVLLGRGRITRCPLIKAHMG